MPVLLSASVVSYAANGNDGEASGTRTSGFGSVGSGLSFRLPVSTCRFACTCTPGVDESAPKPYDM